MARYRGYILAMIGCLVVQTGIYYGLEGLGAEEQLIVTVEMVWLCATVLITLLIGERFEQK